MMEHEKLKQKKLRIQKSSAKAKIKPRRLLIVILAALFVIYFVYIMIWQQVMLSKKNKEISALEEKIHAASQQTEELQKQLESIEDPEYIERIAREKLGLVRPNERVFVDANKSETNQSD